MKIVLDTNVVVSGFLNPYGPPGVIVSLLVAGEILACYDARILTEYREVPRRPKFGLTPASIDTFLTFIEHEGEPTIPAPLRRELPDRDDEPFLEAALAGRADALVTGNLAHFPAALRLGVRVLSPKDFLNLYRRRSD